MGSRIDHGQVELRLGEDVLTLKPTLAAMQKIDRHFGSIREAIVQVSNLSLGAMVIVVGAGAGLDADEIKTLPEQIYRAGVVNLTDPIAEFLAALLNPTGRKAKAAEGDSGKH